MLIDHQRQPLFGRKQEVAFLREWPLGSTSASQPGVAATGASRLLLLGGARGVGKGALARSLLLSPPIAKGGKATYATRANARFVSGRFLPSRAEKGLPPGRPMSAFWDALNLLFDVHVLAETESLQSAILSEFKETDDIETLMEMMPASKRLLEGRRGRTMSEVSEGPPTRTVPDYVKSKRMLSTGLVALAVRFVRAISTCFLPYLVLCMEHLENADSATFELIDDLLGSSTSGGCLHLIATYREDTEPPLALRQLLGRAKAAPMDDSVPREVLLHGILRITVGNLSWDDTYRWVEDRFGQQFFSADMLQSVVDVVYEKSSGNPQFIVYLLEFAVQHMEDCLLNEESVNELTAAIPNSVDDLFALAMQKQEFGVPALVAALGECTGGESVELSTLDLLLKHSCADALASAQKSGILDSFVAPGGRVRLPCTEFQSLAYSMIPESRRLALHLKIGRRLWKSSQDMLDKSDESTTLLLLGAQNLRRAIDLITDIHELNTITNISIGAGKRAMDSSMFPSAAYFFELAISALGDRLWKADCYEISLALFNGVSEAYYCSADFDSVQRSLDAVFENARTFRDKLQAYTTLVYAHTAQHRIEDALSLAAQILQQVGEPFPSNPSNYQVRAEYLKIRRLFRGKPDRFFRSLPTATNPEKVTAMRMMSFTCLTAYIVNPNLSMLMTFRLLQLTLLHGITGPAIVAFSTYAYLLSTHLGSIEEGIRFGKLALSFLDQGDEPAWLPRVIFVVHGLAYRTAFPFRESLEPLRKANRLALKTGDIEASTLMAYAIIPLLFHSGTPLGTVEEEVRSHAKLMDVLGQQLGLTHIVPTWHVICDLLGDTPCPLLLIGAIKDANSAFAIAKEEKNEMAVARFYEYQTIYHCLTGDHEATLEAAKKSRDAARISELWLIFFEGLSALSIARSSAGRARRKMIVIGRSAVKSLKSFCHENFGCKRTLLEAEIAALRGATSRALSLYSLSIELAKEQGFLMDEGLAYERLGSFHSRKGSNAAAIPYYENARRAYNNWGARTLVSRIDQQLALVGGSANC